MKKVDKGGKKAAVNRNKKAASKARHAGKCTVCNHAQVKEIEAQYLGFATLLKIAEDFDLSQDAILRHAQFAGLDEQRVDDTEKVLRSIIGRGFKQVQKIDGKLLMEAVKELNKITGKHQAARENDRDRERKRKQYERAVENFIQAKVLKGESCDRTKAISVLGQIEPEINEYIN